MELEGKVDVDIINRNKQHAITAKMGANNKQIGGRGASQLKRRVTKPTTASVPSVARLENAAHMTRSRKV